jgi:hypothetical protein
MGQIEQLVTRPLGEKADDIFYNILLLKITDPTNGFLPFLYAHSLELSAKTACLKLEIDYSTNGHNLMDIYKSIAEKVPFIEKLIPTEVQLRDYKKIWVSSDPILTKNINILDPKEKQPNPDELLQLELAYFVDNVMNLKYGIDKKKSYVSLIQISYEGLNQHFTNLFIECRKTYSNEISDRRFEEKFLRTFQRSKENQEFLDHYLCRGV